MRNTRLAIATLVLLAPACLHEAPTGVSEPGVTVIYVANEGFLVEADHGKVLVDALFGSDPLDWCPVPDEETGKIDNRHENVEHLAFVIEIGGMRILHLGNAFLDQNRELFESELFTNRPRSARCRGRGAGLATSVRRRGS